MASSSPPGPRRFDPKEFRPGIHANLPLPPSSSSSSSFTLQPSTSSPRIVPSDSMSNILSIEEPASWATVIDEERQRRLHLIREQVPLHYLFRESWIAKTIQTYEQSIEDTISLLTHGARI